MSNLVLLLLLLMLQLQLLLVLLLLLVVPALLLTHMIPGVVGGAQIMAATFNTLFKLAGKWG
jgi:hypothetical protein